MKNIYLTLLSGIVLVGCASTNQDSKLLVNNNYNVTTPIFLEFNMTSVDKNNKPQDNYSKYTVIDENGSEFNFKQDVVYVKSINQNKSITTITSGNESIGFNLSLSKGRNDVVNVMLDAKLLNEFSQNKDGVQKLETYHQVQNFSMSPESSVVYFKPSLSTKSATFTSILSNYNTYQFKIKYFFNFDKVNYNYYVSKNSYEIQAFDNGEHTFIKSNSFIGGKWLALSGEDNTLVNYRILKNYIIVDNVLKTKDGSSLVLLNIDTGEKVKITKLK